MLKSEHHLASRTSEVTSERNNDVNLGFCE